MKRCPSCEETKPLSEFHNSRAHGGKYTYCAVCHRAKSKARYHTPAGKERARVYYLRREIKERELERHRTSPRNALSISINRALKRAKHKTDSPATIDDLMSLWANQGGCCALSGVTMTWRRGKPQNTSISIDRLVSEKGYRADNLRLVCWALNRFRGDGGDEEMYALAAALIANMPVKLRRIS